jgi:hypothetical protein
MNGQATPTMASGRAMAKKASKARMNSMAQGYFRTTEWRRKGRRPGAQKVIRRRSIGRDAARWSGPARSRLRVGACLGGRVPVCPPTKYGSTARGIAITGLEGVSSPVCRAAALDVR